MRMKYRWVCAALSALAILSASMDGQAGERRRADVSKLTRRLKTHAKARVRARAALELGKSGSKKAVAPLCGGLNDKKPTVRAAAALALGDLGRPAGKPCLESRFRRERASNVKRMTVKSMRRLHGASAHGINGATRYYIPLGAIKDKRGRSGPLQQLTRERIHAAAKKLGGFAFAPAGETAKQANKKLRRFPKVEAYLFETNVERIREGDKLTVKVKVSLFSYPANSMLGSITRSAGMTGVPANDSQAESDLAEHAVQALMKAFTKMASAS